MRSLIHHDDIISIIIVSGEKSVDRVLYFVIAKCVLRSIKITLCSVNQQYCM